MIKDPPSSILMTLPIKEREVRTFQIKLDHYLSDKDGTLKMKLFKEALNSKIGEETNNTQVEFQLMKKNPWVNTRE
jgi:hypothetical protein